MVDSGIPVLLAFGMSGKGKSFLLNLLAGQYEDPDDGPFIVGRGMDSVT